MHFPVIFNAVLLLPILYFAGLNSAITYLLIFFLPGYFLLGLFLNSQFYRTIFAAPISLVAISVPSYILGLFFLKTINLLFALTIVVICFIIFYFLKNFPKFSPKEPSKLIHLVAILLAAFAFVELTIHSGGTYFSPIPRIVALDNSMQVTQIDWQVEREIPTLSPWLHYSKEIFTAPTYSPPLSIVVPAFVAKLSGLSTFDAQNLTQSLIFAFTVAMFLVLISLIFNEITAAASALFLAIPSSTFLLSNFSGMTRISLGIFFVIACLTFLILLFRNNKHSGILLGLSILGLSLSHPSDILVLIVPFLFLIYALLNSPNKAFYKAEFTKFLAVCVFGAISFWYIFPFLSIYSAKKLQPFSIMSFEQFEQLASNVGPMFSLSEFSLYAALFALSAVFFIFKLAKSPTSNPQFIFTLSAISTFLLSLGIFVFSYEYQAKLRYVFYAIFLMPVILATFQHFASHLPIPKNRASIAICLLILAPSILTNLPLNFQQSHYFFTGAAGDYTFSSVKLDQPLWETINFIKQNSPKDSSFLAIFLFNQNTSVLTQRKTAYINQSDYLNISKSHDFLSQERGFICIDGFSLNQFQFIYEPCNQTAKIADYDYIVGHFLDPYPIPGIDTKSLKEQLLAKGYKQVYASKNQILVFTKPAQK